MLVDVTISYCFLSQRYKTYDNKIEKKKEVISSYLFGRLYHSDTNQAGNYTANQVACSRADTVINQSPMSNT